MRRAGRAFGIAVLALAAASGCRDGAGRAAGPAFQPAPTTPVDSFGLDSLRGGARGIVSDTTAAPAASHAAAWSIGDEALSGTVAYVSLPPGSVPDGVRALITSRHIVGTVVVPIVDGGFDPVAVPAVPGDVVDITVERRGSAQSVRFGSPVPAYTPPRVVRTRPPRGRLSVPVNSRVEVVFSEPMREVAPHDDAITLRLDGARVAGRLEYVDQAHLTLAFVPAALLRAGRRYALVVDTALRDLDGQSLASPDTVEFTTADSVPGQQALFGAIRITTTTTGVYADSDTYVVRAAGADRLIGVNAVDTITNVPPGVDTVALHATPNCTVQDGATRVVTVQANGTAAVGFAISCTTPNRIVVHVSTTGEDVDGDGVRLALSRVEQGYSVMDGLGGGVYDVGANATGVISGMIAGRYSMAVEGIYPNCTLAGPNPIPIDLRGGGEVSLDLRVSCVRAPELAVADTVDGNWEIYRLRSTGADRVRLTSDPARDASPAWSPDGARIAFRSDRSGAAEIWVMHADGSAPVRLTTNGDDDFPAWSPDGQRIAFTHFAGTVGAIWVMNADGSGAAALTTGDRDEREPAWSPDGTTIAFVGRSPEGQDAIYAMHADGTGVTRLTEPLTAFAFSSPAWSPDGARIAVGDAFCLMACNSNIDVMAADGSARTTLAIGDNWNEEGYGEPAWSPDGRQVAFSTTLGRTFVIATSGGTEYGCCAALMTTGVSPAWRPVR